MNDPSFVFPRRGYSPWMMAQRGQFDSLGIATLVFVLLVVCMVANCLVIALSHSARRRANANTAASVLALMSLLLMGLAVFSIPFDLSFFWPFLDSTVTYGVYLAAAGFAATLLGLALWSAHPQQPARQPA